ncbi:hypothetical protein [Deinococcus sp.]|uniref:hypothetical protein n=1 Tax=Deinococcus sp. TaxID=47478 RepID=UPI003B58FD07
MKRFVLLILALVLTACSGPTTTSPPPPSTQVIIPNTTKVSDLATQSALTAYDRTSGAMRFSQNTPILAALKPGDVLVSEPSSAAPNGYLRKVTTVRTQGGEVVLGTTQAKLTEAVSQGVLDANVDLTPDKVQRTETFLPGVTVTPNASRLQAQVGVGENYAFSVNFNHVFVPQAGPNVSGQITVDGSVSYNVGLGVFVEVKGPGCCPPRLISVGPVEAKVGFAQQASLHISGDVVGDLGEELKIATTYYDPLTFFIGPVPVVVVPRLDLYLSAGGRVEGKFDFQASESAAAQLGARWTPDDGWKNISDFDFSGDVPRPSVSGTLKPRAGVKSTFGFKLYDVAGPEMSLLGSLELDGQIPRNPNWIVNGFLKGDMDFKVELPILGTLADYKVTLFDKSLEFARAGNTPPTLDLTDRAKPTKIAVINGPRTAFLNLREPAFMGNGCDNFGGFAVVAYFIATDAEDGCGVAVTAMSDKDGTLPTSGNYTFNSEGQRRITITVRDGQGTTVSKSFFLYIVNAPPTLTLKNVGDARQGEGYSVAAQIEDPNEADPGKLCARTVWAVDAPDTLATSTGCLQTVTFGKAGARQVRATTTDSDGEATAKTITVNVLPPPANPYPRIVSVSLNSRELKNSGGADFCVTVGVANATPIDLRKRGCEIAPSPGQPAPNRYFVGAAVDNPQNEALTYDWGLYVTKNGSETLLYGDAASTALRFELPDFGNTESPVTMPCSVKFTVHAPEPSRNKSVLAWSGTCTYNANRVN